MSEWERLDRFLRTDPRDGGCDEAGRYPGVAAHLEACGPCAEDLTGLLAAVASD